MEKLLALPPHDPNKFICGIDTYDLGYIGGRGAICIYNTETKTFENMETFDRNNIHMVEEKMLKGFYDVKIMQENPELYGMSLQEIFAYLKKKHNL